MEALEARLERAEALLKTFLPDMNLEDTKHDVSATKHTQAPFKKEPLEDDHTNFAISSETPSAAQRSESEAMLESMIDNTGALDVDDEGHYDFYGTSSGIVFFRCLRDQFGDLMGKAEGYGIQGLKSKKPQSQTHSPRSEGSSATPVETPTTSKDDLPHKDCARILCKSALDDACALLRFVHQPTFWASFDRVYELSSNHYGDEEMRFLPLFYSVLAVGALFARAETSQLQLWGYENAIEQGYTNFPA